MKLWALLWVAGGVLQFSWTVVDGLDHTFQLIIEGGAAAGVMAAGWRWIAGPCWRRARDSVRWVHDRLEVLEDVRPQLEGIHERLDRGEQRFEKIDAMLEVFASEDAQLVRAALREGRTIPIAPGPVHGGPERRSMA